MTGGRLRCLPPVQCHDEWVRFDGNIPHCTLPYTGTRYTLIYFTHQSYGKLGEGHKRRAAEGNPVGQSRGGAPEAAEWLRRVAGFPVPPPGLVKLDYGAPAKLRLGRAKQAFLKWQRSCAMPGGAAAAHIDWSDSDDDERDDDGGSGVGAGALDRKTIKKQKPKSARPAKKNCKAPGPAEPPWDCFFDEEGRGRGGCSWRGLVLMTAYETGRSQKNTKAYIAHADWQQAALGGTEVVRRVLQCADRLYARGRGGGSKPAAALSAEELASLQAQLRSGLDRLKEAHPGDNGSAAALSAILHALTNQCAAVQAGHGKTWSQKLAGDWRPQPQTQG